MTRRTYRTSSTCAIQPELSAPPVPMSEATCYPELRAKIEEMRERGNR